MIFAYADPPYMGCAHRYPEKAEVDQAALIERLRSEFPDGWALSCHTPSLRVLLPLCPIDTRVCAWVKPWCSFKPGVSLAYAWEPVLLRTTAKHSRAEPTVRDWVSSSVTIRQGLVGAKPERFAYWLFEALGMTRDDELIDLYPGTGAIGKALAKWRAQGRLSLT